MSQHALQGYLVFKNTLLHTETYNISLHHESIWDSSRVTVKVQKENIQILLFADAYEKSAGPI